MELNQIQLEIIRCLSHGDRTVSQLSKSIGVPSLDILNVMDSYFYGYITCEASSDSEPCNWVLSLNTYGRSVALAQRKSHLERRNYWIRYIITTGIALVGLIKSFLPELRELLQLLMK